MSKIIIEVDSIGNGKNYEFSIDNNMLINLVKENIVEQIVEVEKENIYFDLDNTILCDVVNGKKLNDKSTLYQENIVSGSRLIIV